LRNSPETSTAPASVQRRARLRIARRLLPFLLILYIAAFLDRVNVAYAGLEMTKDLGFSDRVFGLGAGIFFLGYVLLEIPGALIVERWSARRWIARILISWGVITAFTSLINTSTEFYVMRFLLGVAEAGFFPGVIVYLSHWFRAEDRAKAIAGFMIGIPISSIVGSPIAGLILRVHWLGLNGWRWLFILEGVPAIILGAVTLFYLTDWPHQANWLPEDEKAWLTHNLAEERKKSASTHVSVLQALGQSRVIVLALVYFFGDMGLYGFTIWFPTILKRTSGLPVIAVTLLGTLPYIAALAAVLAVGWHSDRSGERRWHTALPLFIGAAVLFAGLELSASLPLQMILFIVLAACLHCWQPTFWALPTMFLTESAAAASIGLINAIGNLGGFAGPFLLGYMRGHAHSFGSGLAALMFSLLLAGILVLCIKPTPAARHLPSELPQA
jgi:MFS transporter, ACS family, tartrate transporter